MANTTASKQGKRTTSRRQRPRSRRRARAHRPGVRRIPRGFREARTDLREAQRDVRRAGTNVLEAGENVLQAGEAGAAAARELAIAAGERLTDVASQAGHRVGEVAETARERARVLGADLFHLPDLLRESARQGRRLVETIGTRAVVSVLQLGTRALGVAAGFVSELAPRRRVHRAALEDLVAELLGWAQAAVEAYDRTVGETDDLEMRMELVRCKLQTIKQAETLTELLREIGGRVPIEQKNLPLPSAPRGNGARARGPAATRQGLAHSLTTVVQLAEGWRALNHIAARAEQGRVAEAILRANKAVGSEPSDQVEYLRDALLRKTIEAVFA